MIRRQPNKFAPTRRHEFRGQSRQGKKVDRRRLDTVWRGPTANDATVFDLASLTKPIATTIESGKAFYAAEGYHQDFLIHHPTYPYIVVNDLPKVANLKRLFPDLYRDQPVTVAATE